MRYLLVDKITEHTENQSISGIKNVTMSENFLQDHFPGFPVMPGVLQVEAVSQLGSWLIYASTEGKKKARLAGFQAVKFKEFVVPGDQMRIELEIATLEDDHALCNAKVFVENKLKTEIKRVKLVFVPVEDLEDPLKAQEHFNFITGNAPRGGYSAA